MIYFQNLCYILGGLMLLAGLWIAIFPASYRELGMKMIPEKRTWWILPVCLAWVALIIYTWVMYLQYATPVTLIISAVLSLTLIKMYAAIFSYSGYRDFAITFLTTGDTILRVFALIYLGLGALFIAVGLAI